jgi:hypothetical protein
MTIHKIEDFNIKVWFYTFEDLNPHASGVLFIPFKGNVADK